MQFVVLALFVLLPAAVFAFLPARSRRYFLLAALVAFLTVNFFWGRGSPDNPYLIVPLALLGIVAGGLLVEVVVLVRRLMARKGEVASHG